MDTNGIGSRPLSGVAGAISEVIFNRSDKQKNGQNHKASKKTKRSLDESSDSDDIIEIWPSYLVIQSTDQQQPLSKVSAFALHKGIIGMAGKPREVKRLRSGDLLVQVVQKSHSDNLLRCTNLANIPVSVSAHKSLNSVKGVIRDYEVIISEEEEMLRELSAQGVTEVRKIRVRRDGVLSSTATAIVTFGLTTLPSHLTFAYKRIPVDLYIPNPLRCYTCQRYGHHKTTCRKGNVCAKCGTAGHEDLDCDKPARCVNCQGNHTAYNKNCPTWKNEKEIQRIKITEDISFPEARKRVERMNLPISYAAKVKSTRDVACQTCEVACQTDPPPLAQPVAPSADHGQAIGPQVAATTQKHVDKQLKEIRSDQNKTTPIQNKTPPRNKNNKQTPTASHNNHPNIFHEVGRGKGSRPKKGSKDSISLYNRFGLAEMEMEGEERFDDAVPKEPAISDTGQESTMDSTTTNQ